MEEEVEEEIRAPEATKGVTLDPKEVPPSLQEVPPLPKQPPWTQLGMQRISSSTTPTCSMQLSTTPSTPCSCSNLIILAMAILLNNKDIRSRLRSKL